MSKYIILHKVKKVKLNTQYTVFDSQEELKQDDNALMLKAQEAINNAYAPYSHFKVGAAVLLESGKSCAR